MNSLVFLYRIFLYQPLLNLLIFFYNLPFVDFGIAILLLTIFVKALTWRLETHNLLKQRENQIKSVELQQEMKRIQEEYRDDPQKQAEELRRLFKEKGINPFSSFLPLIVQIILIIALFQIFKHPISKPQLDLLYSFVKNPGTVNYLFLRKINLLKPNIFLALLAGASQFFYSKTMFSYQKKYQQKMKKKKKIKEVKESNFQKVLQNQMVYFFPLITVFICLSLPSALALYWSVSTLISFLQMKLIYKK